MEITMRLTRFYAILFVAVLVISLPLIAQDSQEDAAKKAEQEMESAFGTVPLMMKAYPEKMRAAAWEWFKATQSEDAVLPAKYRELIALGVASQIPCSYCVYAHTSQAKMLGATDAEIQEAVASASNTRHWSTVLNGADVDLEQFKKEWDQILVYVQQQSQAAQK